MRAAAYWLLLWWTIAGLVVGLAPVAAQEPTAPAGSAIGPGATVVVTASALNLRANPSTGAAVVEVLAAGTTLCVTGPSTEAAGFVWWPVTNPTTGSSGWVAGRFLAPTGAEPAPSPTATAAATATPPPASPPST